MSDSSPQQQQPQQQPQQQQPLTDDQPKSLQEEAFLLTPDQLLELQFARLRAQGLPKLTEQQMADYREEDYDPEHERMVLTTGLGFTAAAIVGSTAAVGWTVSNNYYFSQDRSLKGFFYSVGRMFQPGKYLKMMFKKSEVHDQEVKLAAQEAAAATTTTTTTTTTTKVAPSTTKPTILPPEGSKVLIQHPPLLPTATPVPPPTTTTTTTTPTTPATSAYAKFQRKTGYVEDPFAKQIKQQQSLSSRPKKPRRFKSSSKISAASKAAARSKAFSAFVIGTIALSGATFGIVKGVCSYFNLDFSQYSKWMNDESSGYTPEFISSSSKNFHSLISRWLWESPAQRLLELAKENLQKVVPVTFADLQMMDQVRMMSVYFLGMEFDIYHGLLRRPSRSLQVSFDDFVEAFQQPIPMTKEEYEKEQLRLLRQIAGLPDPDEVVVSNEPTLPDGVVVPAVGGNVNNINNTSGSFKVPNQIDFPPAAEAFVQGTTLPTMSQNDPLKNSV